MWRAHQPAHAEYEATLYELTPDGRVLELRSVSSGCHPVPVGHVSRLDPGCSGRTCREGVRCGFGQRWEMAAQRVAIEGRCTDGANRWIEFNLHPEALEFVSVRGETGWAHNDWNWVIDRCQDRLTCESELDDVPTRSCG